LLALLTPIVKDAPSTARRPVAETLAALNPAGGTKKSLALEAVPYGVETEILPEDASIGTVVVIALVLAVATLPGVCAKDSESRVVAV
jgi:hypothetical protein